MHPRGKNVPCTYCRRPMTSRGSRGKLAATKDHVLPRGNGGTHKVWCCTHCNMIKANLTPAEWAAFMRINPGWWRMPEFQQRGIRLRDRWKYTAAAAEATVSASSSSSAPSE